MSLSLSNLSAHSSEISCLLFLTLCILILARRTLHWPYVERSVPQAQCHLDFYSALGVLRDSTIHQRALANAQLVHTFSLTNTFVSFDKQLQKEYRRTVALIIENTDWSIISRISSEAAAARFPASSSITSIYSTRSTINLMDSCRQVTLTTVIYALFGVRNPAKQEISFIGKEIHYLWLEMKGLHQKPYGVQQSIRARGAKLKSLLQGMIANTEEEQWPMAIQKLSLAEGIDCPEFNPLNLVIPAFETLWRVVFYALVSALRQEQNCQHPSFWVQLSSYRPGISTPQPALNIIREVLRVYPPTRTIRREGLPSVSITSIHKDPSIWTNPEIFDPSRFSHSLITMDERLGWLPFSTGRMQCPAFGRISSKDGIERAGFAMTLAAIICRAMAGHIDASMSREMVAEQCGLSSMGLLEGGRQAYGDLKVMWDWSES